MSTPWPFPFWIAHRGAGRQAPENTLAALRLGLSLGYAGFEVDAKISADGVPFLLHDTTLDRTTTESGRASDRNWAELRTLDAGSWHHSEHAFEPIPSLEQALDLLFAHGCHLNIEIKPTPGDEGATARTVAEHTLLQWKAALPQRPNTIAPLLSSFHFSCLEAARDAAPELPRALLINRERDHWMERAQEVGCAACVVQHEMVTAAMVQELQSRGMKVWVYTVNEEAEAQKLIGWKVDGIITDAVHRFDPKVHPLEDPRGLVLQAPARF